jgi:hypothetical protein
MAFYIRSRPRQSRWGNMTPSLPHRITLALEFYFLRPIPNALPPEWIAIILKATGIGPVGASQHQTSELPP